MKGAGMFGTGFRGALIALALMLSLPAGALAQGPGQGPGGPILVVTGDSFGSYYAEILKAEGLNEFAVAGRSALNAQTLAGYQRRRARRRRGQRPAGVRAQRLGTGRREPDRDAARLEPGAAAGARTGHRRPRERLHRRREQRGSGSRDNRRHDAVPRHGRPAAAERRDRRGDALLGRDHRDDLGGGHAAQRRLRGRPGSRVRLRPRELGRLDAPGQPRLGRRRARRLLAGPLERPVLRRRHDADWVEPRQGAHPAGRRAAAPAGEPDHADEHRPAAAPALLVLPARREGRRS